ncbi:MAG TPA: CusA/CzcA family heavy metal efflux RND transporter [Bryobacteraceae bacterium]|nr:CusA/CzcA family heavy metal efflux RND transporter [Bryobacteraceae bacterium]
MLNRIIDFALDNRWLTLALLALMISGSLFVAFRIPIDAFPDLTNNQVVIITECPGLSPSEVEQSVTFPIESAVMGLPSTQGVRSISKLGLSTVTIIFDDDVNTWFARQMVNERVQEVRSRLPVGLEPSLGPVATAFGEVYQYTVEGPQSLMDRKTLHDWQIRFQLRTVPGVNEVNSWGGETRQYTVELDPISLRRYGLTIRDVFERLRDNNRNFGGGFIEHAAEQYTVRGLGRTEEIEDIDRIVLSAHAGTPVLVRDVARVHVGSVPRQGAVLRDGKGETVSGMTIMLKGENGLRVIDRVKERLATLRLPEGVRIVPFYDQSEVINGTIRTVTRNLIEAGLLVLVVLLVFLGNVRAALIVACVIPISMLFGFLGMAAFGVSANLMSLGAIDFGMVVDGAVVMMENSVRRLAHDQKRSRLEVIREAAHEVARPIVFAVAIIIAVYLPIFTLQDLEGRMFRPMAITVCSLLVGSLILALTVVPVLASFALKGPISEKEEGWFARLRNGYRRSLVRALRTRPLVLAAATASVAVAVGSVAFIGTEFMPKLDEGSILITTRKLPGIGLTESVNVSNAIEKTVLRFPEVRSVVTKLGRPDLATEAMGIYEADVYILLKPREEWVTAHDKQDLIQAMSRRLGGIPGVEYNFTQPMAMRLDEVVSGIKADVAVKIFGEDSEVLERLAAEALRILSSIPGAADTQAEVLSGVSELKVEVDRGALARYGLNVTDVQDVVDSATGGERVSEMVEGQRRFPISVRLPAAYREDVEAMGNLLLQSSAQEQVRLNQVARLTVERGPEVVSRESAQRRIIVQANVRGRDLGSFVEEAQKQINARLALPAGYDIDWGGQFENQERASQRFMIVLPISVFIIFGLLYAAFGSAGQATLILMNVPFALVGGIAALWLRGLNLNVSASIGFIALFGVAVLNGVVMVSYINKLRDDGLGMEDALLDGASLRLRPVLMTALVASLGFIPMAVSTATGAEVQRPLATVVIGGLITATILTLYVLPLLYPWFTATRSRQGRTEQ